MTFEHETSGRAWRLHLAVWRWHFYAGLCVLPLLLVLTLSGLAMLASEPLDRYRDADLLGVTPRGTPLSPSAQAAAVAAAYPHSELATFRAAASDRASTRIDVVPTHGAGAHGGHSESAAVAVFVDPYTGVVLGEHDVDGTLYAWAKKLHGTLLLGTVGDYVIEIAAGFGVLLIVTGLYLWWPRRGRTWRAALLPSVAASGRRRWRDLHGALGAWFAPVLLFFLVSGLAWTPYWGGALVQAWSSLPGEKLAAPLAEETHAALNHGVHREVPWAVEQTPMPASGGDGVTAGTSHHVHTAVPAAAALDDDPSRDTRTAAFGLDDVVEFARAEGFETFRVHFPRGDSRVWTIASTTIAGDTRQIDGDRIVHLDPASGRTLAEIRFADYSPMGRFMAAGIPLHQADTGAVNLIVNVLVCLAVIGMSVAAIAAWWARRPAGARRLVPPPLPRDTRAWRSAVALMLALSLAFPLAAATIVAVLAIDWLVLSRVRALDALLE